jgi:cytochrome c1
MDNLKQTLGLIFLAAALIVGCGGENSNSNSESNSPNNESGLTDFEMENGIGPIDEEIMIEEIDQQLAKEGAQIFETKCSACHKMDDRYVGPPLSGITNIRTPTYLMNMILNPEEMIKKHPIAKSLMQEYLTPMPNQNLSREEARAVVEYLASNPE